MVPVKSKRSTRRKSKKRNSQTSPISLRGVFITLVLLSFLLFSIGTLGYFIFFRTVVAAEIGSDIGKGIVFEEPLFPSIITPEDKTRGDISAPKCAIIIDDMGYHRKIGMGLMDLPLNLTFSFLPHAPYTGELEEFAYQSNRTVMLHLPLQPQESKWDPGPGALYLNDVVNQKRIFHENLKMVPHATGVNNHMGSLYTEDREVMGTLLQLIVEKKLFFIDSYTSVKSVGLEVAGEVGVESARRHIFLDNVLSVEEICKQMDKLVAIAKSRGSAIGIAHPNRETLQALVECGETLQASVTLVGVEELVQ